MSSSNQRVIVALDVADRAAALRLIEQLNGLISVFKVGNQLFTAEGPGLVREISGAGLDVFLDLKFHDIPNTVAGAVGSACRLGVAMTNVHASGGLEMMKAAAGAAGADVKSKTPRLAGFGGQRPGSQAGRNDEQLRPAVIGVTVLTSMDQRTLTQVGVPLDPISQAVMLAGLARQAGLDGVVASPQEVAPIREHVRDADFIIVTPGVRPAGSATGDQKRIGSPAQAIRDGADYLVIGRPITASPDPRATAERILQEIQ
jgi:orotidine-5'-phosphate decarboxylase